jgi:hypothetical protein
MKISFHFNLTLYLIVIGLYIYQPILGALGQFLIGLIQLLLAIKIALEIDLFNDKTKKYLKYYWRIILIWLFLITLIIIANQIEKYNILIMCIIPMIIGFYFLLVTYLIQKNITK